MAAGTLDNSIIHTIYGSTAEGGSCERYLESRSISSESDWATDICESEEEWEVNCERYSRRTRIVAPLRSENTSMCWGTWIDGGSPVTEERWGVKNRELCGWSEEERWEIGRGRGGIENWAVKENVLPQPSSLWTQIVPPRACTICLDIASPNPVPPYFLVAL